MKKVICALLSFLLVVLSAMPVFAGQKNEMNISIDSGVHEISNSLYGISLQDMGFGIGAGLSSQMVNNNSFEYSNNPEYAWNFFGMEHSIAMQNPMNKNNTSYEVLSIKENSVMKNYGYTEIFDEDLRYDQSKVDTASMTFVEGESYEFSCYLMNIDFNGSISVFFDCGKNKSQEVKLDTFPVKNSKWTKVSAKLTAAESSTGALAIRFSGKGSICIDFVSLVAYSSYGFGEERWANSTLNKSAFELLKNLNPSFIMFPGSGVLEKSTDSSLSSWKNTIGSQEERKQNVSIYDDFDNGYCVNNANSVGYHEYFQLCDDLGAISVVQVGAGIGEQSSDEYEAYLQALNKTYMTDEQFEAYLTEQYGYKKKELKERIEYINSLGIKTKEDFDKYLNSVSLTPNTDEFTNYAQDILDLIEYANGDSTQTYWGSVRKQNGSEKPFDMKYIQIGVDNYGETYWRNFEALKEIINKKYPDIIVLASLGEQGKGEAFDMASSKINSAYKDCMASEKYEGTKQLPLSVGASRFDSYSRDNAGVIAGYKSTISEENTILSAVDVASYLLGIEKNSDAVKMAYYTDTFAKKNATDNSHSLVWIDEDGFVPTAEYYVQQIFGNNVGSMYLASSMSIDNEDVSSSVSIDEKSQCVYIKLVNTGKKREKIEINLSGCDSVNVVSAQSISAKNKKETSLASIEEVIEANGMGFEYEIKPYSASVIRVAYNSNEGMSLFKLPNNTNKVEKKDGSMSTKMFILMVAAIFVLSTVITYFVYSKTVLKGKKFKFNFKKNNRKKGK